MCLAMQVRKFMDLECNTWRLQGGKVALIRQQLLNNTKSFVNCHSNNFTFVVAIKSVSTPLFLLSTIYKWFAIGFLQDILQSPSLTYSPPGFSAWSPIQESATLFLHFYEFSKNQENAVPVVFYSPITPLPQYVATNQPVVDLTEVWKLKRNPRLNSWTRELKIVPVESMTNSSTLLPRIHRYIHSQ